MSSIVSLLLFSETIFNTCPNLSLLIQISYFKSIISSSREFILFVYWLIFLFNFANWLSLSSSILAQHILD